MIWNDKVQDILSLFNSSTIFQTRSTNGLDDKALRLYNKAKDRLCMVRPWRDLLVTIQQAPDAQRKITLPADFGYVVSVYIDPSNIGKPMWWYSLRCNDIARRYDEEVTFDPSTGFTRKLVFPNAVVLPGIPYICYSKAIPDSDGSNPNEISFFPQGLMLIMMKKLSLIMIGTAGNDNAAQLDKEYLEELKLFEAYAYENNTELDMSVKDRFGNPIVISGGTLDGSASRVTVPSPFLPSTLYTGGQG